MKMGKRNFNEEESAVDLVKRDTCKLLDLRFRFVLKPFDGVGIGNFKLSEPPNIKADEPSHTVVVIKTKSTNKKTLF
jgi:hypothetical protein